MEASDIFSCQAAGGGKHMHKEGLSPDMAFYNPFNDQPHPSSAPQTRLIG